MSAIPNKLQKERTIEGKCKYVHKYMRFAKHNKTYRRDVYYCALCGHKVKIDEIFGKYTLCWKCGKPFSIPIAMLKLRPTCPSCNHKSVYSKLLDVGTFDFLTDSKEGEPITKEDVLSEMLDELNKKPF